MAVAHRRSPFLQGVLPIDRASLPAEIIAGTTLAALAIPEVMGYTSIAGMPVVTGLYTLLVPVLLFALLGSSRHLVVGADSATAAIMAAALAGLAAAGSSKYVALAGLMALVAGLLLLIARLARLGFLANFLSRTVLIGFLTGVGIQVSCEQVAGMLGVSKGDGKPIEQLVDALKNIPNAQAQTVAVSVGVLLLVIGGGYLAPKVPWALFAVIGSIVVSEAVDLAAHGVATIGTVPSGLPTLGFPDVPLSDVPELLGAAASIFIVILAQSAATSRAYAAKFGDVFDENVDLVGLSAASVGAGLTGTFVVNGSPTKTEMVDSAGGRNQLAQLTMAVCVVIVLLFLTAPLSYMPSAVLSSVVFIIALRLIDIRAMRDVRHRRPSEFVVAVITAGVVVGIGVKEGIIAAMVLSIIFHLRHSYRPHDLLVVTDPQTGALRSTPLAGAAQAEPGLVIYHFGAGLYYANADRFRAEILALADTAQPKLQWLCLAGGAIGDLDYSASATLRTLYSDLRTRNVTLVTCSLMPEVRAEFDRDGLTDLLGQDHMFGWPDEVIAAYRKLAT